MRALAQIRAEAFIVTLTKVKITLGYLVTLFNQEFKICQIVQV